MSEAEKKKRWKLAINILTVAGLLGLGYFIRHQIFETIENFHKINIWVLLLIFPIEFWNYDSYARMYRRLFKLLGNDISYRDMLKVTSELTLVNHVFPSGGVSGFSYFGIRMRSLGVTTGKATLVQTMKFILLFLSFEVILLFALISLAFGGKVNNFVILVSSSVATLLLVGTLGGAFLIGSKQRINTFFTYITRAINKVIHVVRPNQPETINIAKAEIMLNELHDNYKVLKKDWRQLRAPLLYGLCANLSEILVIYVVYIAFGEWVNPGAVMLAYAIANFAGLISVLPGGVGVYEALMTGVLVACGIPAALSLPVTVMYRVVNMTIQIIPGYYFYHKAINANDELEEVTHHSAGE